MGADQPCLAKTIQGAYVLNIDFGRTIGPFRLALLGARSESLQKIDEIEAAQQRTWIVRTCFYEDSP